MAKIFFVSIRWISKDQAEKFRLIFENILKLDDNERLIEGLKALMETIVHENISLIITRQTLFEFSSRVPKLSA